MSENSPEKHRVDDNELYWKLCEAAVRSPPIITECPLFGHTPRAFIGIDSDEIKRIMDEAHKYPAYQINILNRIIKINGLWSEKYYDAGRSKAHVFMSSTELLEMFPEYAENINGVLGYNRAVRKGEWVRAIDYLGEFKMTSQYRPYYPGKSYPYAGVDDEEDLTHDDIYAPQIQKVEVGE